MQFSVDVHAALTAKSAVVALESTILAHGLPHPQNRVLASTLESTIASTGATPATIAVIGGRPHIGLTAPQLDHLCQHGASYVKAAARDLSIAAARGTNAATTVSATAWLAARAGIQVFATGGIGGVHRGDAADISADIPTLARVPLAVVSAGAKAILDLPRTLEAMETAGILVVGYQTDRFPAFYTRDSGLSLEHTCDTIEELAAVCLAHWRLGLGGILVANPIPAAAALDAHMINDVIADALARVDAEAITGKAITPFLLAHLAHATKGQSVAANCALATHNAAVAASLALALATH